MKNVHNVKRKLLFNVIIAIGLVYIYICLVNNGKIVENSNDRIHMQIDNSNGGIKASEAELYQRKELVNGGEIEFVIWKESSGIIENSILGRTVKTNIIPINGHAQILFDERVPYMDSGEDDICILGYKTAIELFGTTNIENVEVQKKEKTYKVIGILNSIENAFVYPTNLETEILDRVAVVQNTNNSSIALKQKFESNYFKANIIDYEFITFITQILMVFPIFVFASFLIKDIFNLNKYQKRKEIKWLIASFLISTVLLIIIGTIKVKKNQFYDYIPSKWSDFEFFRELYIQKKENFFFYLKNRKSEIDMLYFVAFLKTGIYFFLEIILFLIIKLQSYSHKNILRIPLRICMSTPTKLKNKKIE